MNLGELKPAAGSTKDTKRLGRGPGSGLGKTSGRGHKGSGARSGSKTRTWFEGGQMSLQRRLPKRGFSNHLFRKDYQIVNLVMLDGLKVDTVDSQVLFENGMIRSPYKPVKILADGEITRAVEVTADAFSSNAIAKIEKLGGSAKVL
ncbi:MAG: 50S ribosomal protein L15 [Candidatus Marinimicrobia bacterium]|nr:50S ribosomal protein L15 [Candidatus Neomarinimicrobiota bacterium]